MERKYSYKDAGVDIDAGNQLVNLIKPFASSTKRIGADAKLGGFGALFDLKACGYNDPILVSATDGVGTKLKIAQNLDFHDGIGIDLVAMCVNDLLVQGAEPLFFLDYFACGKLEVEKAAIIIKSIAEGCKQAGCALIGGETAEMPDMYHNGDYDLAGFAVGVVERENILPSNVQEGDFIYGIASSGVHSNGYSLVRKLVDDYSEHLGDKTLGEILLTPTKIYISDLLPLIKQGKINAMAHITGGGILENIPRILPGDLAANIKLWEFPEIFRYLQQKGNIDLFEMLKTFNCGIGMIVISNQKLDFPLIGKIIKRRGEAVEIH